MCRVHAVGTPMPLETGTEREAWDVPTTVARWMARRRTGRRDVLVWEIRRGR